MEHLEALLQSASYLGVFKKLMAMSSTDIAVLFLVSKPAFILTAGIAVLTARKKDDPPKLESDEDSKRLISE